MKNVLVLGFGVMLMLSQASFAQAVEEGKAAKKEMKAEKKVAKAKEKRMEARTHKGLEIAGVSTPKVRMKAAERKEDKAEKKILKAESHEMKAEAKEMKKKAAKVD